MQYPVPVRYLADRARESQNPFGWQSLKIFGANKLLQSSYFWLFFVPIAARLLGEAPEKFDLTVWGNDIQITLKLPFSWKVFFYASVSFSIASFIYTLRCPALIKDYRILDDFKAEGRTPVQVLWLYRKCLYARGYDRALVDEITRSFAQKHTSSAVSPDHTPELLDKHFADAFHAARYRVDCFSPKLRGACAFAYLVGFALIIVVAAQNLWFVIRAT